MTRIYTHADDEKPRISGEAVHEFFEKRAEKARFLGPTRAVIYQDKSIDLAERRDSAEKGLLLPLLNLNTSSKVLDAGCGTGRWAEVVIPLCASYCGVDASPGLIRIADERFGQHENARFIVCALNQIGFDAIGDIGPFNVILSLGVFIYLNDDEVLESLQSYAKVASDKAKILFREPVSLVDRLTLKEHYSDDMDQHYSAIYRTESELLSLIETGIGIGNFVQSDSGDVYSESELNNRSDTIQRWYMWERQ